MRNQVAIGLGSVAIVAIAKTANQDIAPIGFQGIGDTVDHRWPRITVLFFGAQFHHVPAEIRYSRIYFIGRILLER